MRKFESGRTFGHRETEGKLEVSYTAGIRLWNAEGEMIAATGERGDADFWLAVLLQATEALKEARAAK